MVIAIRLIIISLIYGLSNLNKVLPVHNDQDNKKLSETGNLDTRRNQENSKITTGLIYGNSSSLNYYYTELYVGTPPQKQSVILDTGSSTIAIPCQPYCTDCGNHLNSYYLATNSRTNEILDCNTKRCSELGSSCNIDQKCEYSINYGEGSTITGFWMYDQIQLNTFLDLPSAKIEFGCTTKESEMFYKQAADGILGLNPTENSFIQKLFNSNVISKQIFSLCFASNGGYMTLNGVNSTLHTSQLEYIPYYSNNQYKVQLKNLALNDKQIILKDQDFPTIIDSGTTLTYFPKTIFQSIEEKIKSFCLETNRCLGKLKKTDSGMCFEPNENINFVQLVESMPTLNFEFENFVNYEWSPYNYLYEDLDDDNVQYCMGFDTWTSNAIVLGTTWMHNHDIIFDLDKKRIGFALANCNNDKQTSEINRQKYYNNCHKEITTYKKILLSLIAFIIIGFILVSIAISRLRDGKPLLWSRVSSILVEKEMSIIVIKH